MIKIQRYDELNGLYFISREELSVMKSLSDFIEVQRTSVSSADKKLDSIITDIFVSLEEMLAFDLREYTTIRQLIEEKRDENDEQSYFWDWMDETGLTKLRTILSGNLHDSEELHDLLDYREMLLQLDKENKIVDGLFASIVDTLNNLDEFNQGISEQAAAIEHEGFTKKLLNESIEYKVSGSSTNEKQRWTVNPDKSPAGKGGAFVIL